VDLGRFLVSATDDPRAGSSSEVPSRSMMPPACSQRRDRPLRPR
jgi:hypothetical protein